MNNLHFNSNGRLVYGQAAIGIVLNIEENTQSFFGSGDTKKIRGKNANTDCITAIAKHSNGKIFATGQNGKNPSICVWDSTEFKKNNCKFLAKVKTFKAGRQCTSLAFNKNGSMLAATLLDNDHQLYQFTDKSNDYKNLNSASIKTGPDKLLTSSFSSNDILCIAGKSGKAFFINFMLSPKERNFKKKGLFGTVSNPPRAFLCSTWVGD